MDNRKILVLGSIAYDFIMSFSGDMNQTISMDPINHLFNLAVMPETKEKLFGGTAGNIGYNLSLLGAHAALVTSVGKDFIDLGYKDRIEYFPNVNFEGEIHPDSYSATCYIVNDYAKNQLIIFHRGAMNRGTSINLKEKYPEPNTFKIASLSPDYSPAMIKWAHELVDMKIPYIFDPGQVTPEFSRESLLDLIPKSYLLIGNEYEINMILKIMNYTLKELLSLNSNLIITQGAKGSECHYQGNIYQIPSCRPEKIMDPTGAGDGFRAGLLFGLAGGLLFENACKLGSVVGSFVVESLGPQSQQFTITDIHQRFQKNFHQSLIL
ncbi:MAG: hypothetical protein JW776_15215 [Candidatus Lokiarchaeota archaeon]|nr:hypothetical protein [Candidatus Lokiarchaeota archaeon]